VWTDVKLAAFAALVAPTPPKVATDDAPVVEATHLSDAARWEEAPTFGRTVTLEAHRPGLSAAAEVASPNDGALWIADLVDLVAPQAVHILDEPHAAEHLGVSGALVFGGGSPQAQQWVDAQRDQLLYGSPSAVLPALARCLLRGPCPRGPRRPQSRRLAGPRGGLLPQPGGPTGVPSVSLRVLPPRQWHRGEWP
jgi:hypothetical protein